MLQPQNVRRVSVAPLERKSDTPVVLVVTADANLRAAAERVLEREGYRVLTASHAGHAVLACRTAGRVDVLATELSMEEVSGPALAERLRRHCEVKATLYFANSGTPEIRGVLVRPFTRDDLVAALATSRAAVEAALPTAPSAS